LTPIGGCNFCNCCEAPVIVDLVGTCGFELTGGLVYSMGNQAVDVDVTDDCGCIESITINGSFPPVYVLNKTLITISINLAVNCHPTEEDDPTCIVTAPMFYRRRKKIFMNTNVFLNQSAQKGLIKKR
jgi:hypothetical protein